MARYLETAARYEDLPLQLLQFVPPEHHDEAVCIIARLVNAGVVSVPRSAQSTVRLNIVNRVCQKIPVKCGLEERAIDPTNPERGTYKALTTKFSGVPHGTVG